MKKILAVAALPLVLGLAACGETPAEDETAMMEEPMATTDPMMADPAMTDGTMTDGTMTDGAMATDPMATPDPMATETMDPATPATEPAM